MVRLRQTMTSVTLAALFASAAASNDAPAGEGKTAEPVEELGAVLALQPDPARGAGVFKACAHCHGANGGGSLDGTVPSLAAQHYRYLAKQMVEFRNEQRSAGPIHLEMTLTALSGPRDIADVAAYLADLPPAEKVSTGPGTLIARGEQLYRATCQSCHGEAAVGKNDLGIPSLHGQHYRYLSWQISNLARGHRFNSPPDLTLLLQYTPPEDIEALADYLSRLPFAKD